MKKLLLVSLLCFSLVGLAEAQNISGTQSGTLGPGTYVVVGDISVRDGTTLTILPGTTFLHSGAFKWDILGQFNAEGTETDSIYFIRQNPTEDCRWRSLRFQPGASSNSTIDYCVIDNCKIPSGVPSAVKGGGIYTNSVNLSITNTRISNCDAYWDGGGIYADNAAITVENFLIVDNTATLGANGGGIYLNNCNGVVIRYNEIARNSATGT
jgi:hypothetical protein